MAQSGIELCGLVRVDSKMGKDVSKSNQIKSLAVGSLMSAVACSFSPGMRKSEQIPKILGGM